MNPSLIAPFLAALRSDWQEEENRDEWFFAGLEEKIVSGLDVSEAFRAIDEVAPVILAQRDPYLVERAGLLMMALARKSNTTEMPSSLSQSWEQIEERLEPHPSVLEDLSRWYRITRKKEPIQSPQTTAGSSAPGRV
jgi:hypothetical protein